MHDHYDVIIIGLGAMGSAAAYHLAERGRKVLGLEQFTPAHQLGSSHGETRIIREAYFESPVYVPIVQRAYELWQRLEAETEKSLFRKTGGLMIGPADGILVRGARTSAVEHKLPFELLSSRKVKKRFPALNPADQMVAIWEPRAGILRPDLCIQAHLQMAEKKGAVLHFEEAVLSWKSETNDVQVTTAQSCYQAKQLLLCTGAWTAPLLQDLCIPLKVGRQVLFWFQPRANPEQFSPNSLPIFMMEFEKDRIFYGFPDFGNGVKVAIHGEGELTNANQVRRTVESAESAELTALMDRFLPDAAGTLLKSDVCMYTNTPDGHFLIDFHPHHHQVLIASPCSGHGFKFSSTIGELLADLLTTGQSRFDLDAFSLNRF